MSIPKQVINSIANQLYNEFTQCSEKEQEYLLDSGEMVKLLWNKHVITKEKNY